MRVRPIIVLLLVLPGAAAHHSSPDPASEVETISTSDRVTWRAVAFAPDASHALMVGKYGHENRSRDVIARWTLEGGAEEVYNRSGSGLVDVAFHKSGTSLVVGIQNTLLLGTPESYRNVWNDTEFAQAPTPLTFYGLRGAFKPGEDFAIVAGSSLLRVELDGAITVVHGGRAAFFRATAWNPTAPYALVEVAVEREGRALLGAVWRTNGTPPLGETDNVAIYGRFAQGKSLLNTIAFSPNGSFALLSGRDGAGASILTWASHRTACHEHGPEGDCHDHQWQYQPTFKSAGPITCIAWHPSGRFALAVGLDRDQVGYVGTRVWVPVMHNGADLFGCAYHPSGAFALAVGAEGTLALITPGSSPLGAVVLPDPGALVPPARNATFLVGVLDRGSAEGLNVTGRVEGESPVAVGVVQGPWWNLTVDARGLKDGAHRLLVRVGSPLGGSSLGHVFLVNNQDFTPPPTSWREPDGLEGQGLDSDGVFTLRWQLLDAPVVYEVHEKPTAASVEDVRKYATAVEGFIEALRDTNEIGTTAVVKRNEGEYDGPEANKWMQIAAAGAFAVADELRSLTPPNSATSLHGNLTWSADQIGLAWVAQATCGETGDSSYCDKSFATMSAALQRLESVEQGIQALEVVVERVLPAGPRDNLTVKVNEDGSYIYRVRAVNSFNASEWSDGIVINVVLDSDGDGVPDSKDPRPFLEDTWGDGDGDGITDDLEYLQCSDPTNRTSTPATDADGDGIANGQECLSGSDPADPLDPLPADDGPDEVTNGDDGGDEGNGSPGVTAWALLVLLAGAALVTRSSRAGR